MTEEEYPMRGVYLIGAALISMLVSAENGFCGELLPIPVGQGAAVEYVYGDTGHAAHTSGGAFIWDAPVGDRAVVAFPLPEGERFEDYGLGKVDIEIEGGPAEVMIFIERPGEKRRIYRPIDISDPPIGARTIYFEYERPEIVRASHETPAKPRIALHLWSMDTGWPDQQPSRRITVSNLRLSKRRLDVGWNGFQCRESTMPDGGIVIEYPIVVRNLDTVPRTVIPRLDRLEGRYGSGKVTPQRATTAPGESARFTVRLELPGEARAKTGPLWCEWFLPVFCVEGVTDSDEVILRSSDAIALPLIVMPDFRGPVATLDRDGIQRIRRMYATSAWAKKEGDGIIASADRALENGLSIPDGPGWTQAYYYCHAGIQGARSPLLPCRRGIP